MFEVAPVVSNNKLIFRRMMKTMFSSNQGAEMGSGSKALLAYHYPVQRLVTHIGTIVSSTLDFH